jgi:hypothetical protein
VAKYGESKLLTMVMKKYRAQEYTAAAVEAPPHKLPAGWSAAVDPGSGRAYWYNATTQETTWTSPGGAPPVDPGSGRA